MARLEPMLTQLADDMQPVWLKRSHGVRWVWHKPTGWLFGWVWVPGNPDTVYRDMGISWLLIHLGPGFLEVWKHRKETPC